MNSATFPGAPARVDRGQLRRRVAVALGREPGDLLLKGGQVLNVFTGRVERADVVIADGWIAGVGRHHWQAAETADVSGRVLVPGFIDSHMHLESTLLLPGELARLIVPRGTTTTVSDSHEVGNVLGLAGIEKLERLSAGAPFDLFFTASSCVPDVSWDHSGAALGPEEVAQLLGWPRVLGLAEMMNLPGLFAGDAEVLDKILAAWHGGRPVDGHAPGVLDLPLQACAAAYVRSDHESETAEEAVQKARAGMLVQIREGSVAQNLDAVLPAALAGELGGRWTFVTDDILPTELVEKGHLDYILARAIAAGVPAEQALIHASWVPARHYRLDDRGAVAPGYRADVVVLPDVQTIRPEAVYKNGRLVARGGECLTGRPPTGHGFANTVRLGPLDASAFRVRPSGPTVPVIQIIPGKLMTALDHARVAAGREWAPVTGDDLAMIASIERHRGSGQVGVGFARGFGLRGKSALASSVAHDAHNVIVVGTDPATMLAAVREVARLGGGFVAAAGAEVRSALPLPFAGLLADEGVEVVVQQLRAVEETARQLGCTLPSPFGALSFLALPVIPEVRITDQGVFDVGEGRFLPV